MRVRATVQFICSLEKRLHNMQCARYYTYLACNCKWNRIQNSHLQAKTKKCDLWLDCMQHSIGGSSAISQTLRSVVCSCTILSINKRFAELAKWYGLLLNWTNGNTIQGILMRYSKHTCRIMIATKLAKFGRVCEYLPAAAMTCHFLCFRTTRTRKEHTAAHKLWSFLFAAQADWFSCGQRFSFSIGHFQFDREIKSTKKYIVYWMSSGDHIQERLYRIWMHFDACALTHGHFIMHTWFAFVQWTVYTPSSAYTCMQMRELNDCENRKKRNARERENELMCRRPLNVTTTNQQTLAHTHTSQSYTCLHCSQQNTERNMTIAKLQQQNSVSRCE